MKAVQVNGATGLEFVSVPGRAMGVWVCCMLEIIMNWAATRLNLMVFGNCFMTAARGSKGGISR